MEYVDEESRPRFQIQSRPLSSSSNSQTLDSKPSSKLHILTCFSFSLLILLLSFKFFSDSQTISFLLIWFSLSLLIAPFAPCSLTGGDPTVGAGPTLPDPIPTTLSDPEPDRAPRRSRARKPDTNNLIPVPSAKREPPKVLPQVEVMEEKEWSENDFDILKKQMAKHPVGEPQRWEKVAEAFEGRHKVESVIKMGKSFGERKVGDKDSFAQFLKQRKPMDKRVESVGDENGVVEKKWTSSEDIALLNALKAFPKDVGMRWEKVAAAVEGRTKGECVKRVAELKKGFRSSKGAES